MAKGPDRSSARKIKAAERRNRAVEMRKCGASLATIGAELGVTKQAAHKAIKRGLKELDAVCETEVSEYRRLELERMDAMLLGIWDKARNGDGKAIDRVLRIMKRRAELLGLDEPTKQAVDATVKMTSFSEFMGEDDDEP